MSDERDDADDIVGGGDDAGAAGLTARAGTPPRPTGKRRRGRAGQAEGAEITEALDVKSVEKDDDGEAAAGKAKKKPKKKARTGPSRNPFVFVFNYLKQVIAELRKVIWPNRKQMVTYTSVVLAFLVFMVALISLADLGLAKLVLSVFG